MKSDKLLSAVFISALLILSSIFNFSCSFMDSQWGSEVNSSGSEKKNNATVEDYFSKGKKIGVTLNFITVLSEVSIPEYFAGEKVVRLHFNDITSKTSTTTIIFPDTVISFDNLAGFSSLKTLVLSESLSEIKQNSFTGCRSLSTIIVPAENPPVVKDTKFLTDSPTTLKIYVPAKSLSLYKEADGWKNFSDNLEKIAGTEEESTDSTDTGDSGNPENTEVSNGQGGTDEPPNN